MCKSQSIKQGRLLLRGRLPSFLQNQSADDDDCHDCHDNFYDDYYDDDYDDDYDDVHDDFYDDSDFDDDDNDCKAF